MTDLNATVKEITDANEETEVLEAIGEAIYDFIDDGWEDEFDDITEAYGEQGRGEAENQVLTQIIHNYENVHGKFTTDEWCEVIEELCEFYNVSTG